MKKEFNQKSFKEFKENVVSTRQRIIDIITPSNMMMCQTLTENKAKNFLKECINNNIHIELNTNSHESIKDFMDYIAILYHAKGLALEDTDKPTINDMVKYYHICQCDAIIYQNDEATDEELFNNFDVMPLDMLNDEKLKEYNILFEAFEKYIAYYDENDKSELLYDLCKQKKKQSIKIDDNIRQIMYALIDWYNVDEEDITTNGHPIFINNCYEETVEFCGKDGEYYHFVTSGYYSCDGEYDESDYFVKIENGAAYTYEDGIIDSLIVCLDKTKNDDFYIKNGTKYIGKFAFKDCNFENIIVPGSVKGISKDDFFPSNIKKITLKSKRINICDKKDESFVKIINFEKSELESFIKEDGSLVIPNNITEIPSGTFKGYTSLRNIIIPASITRIGDDAFDDCISLIKVNYTGTIDQWASISFGNGAANPLSYVKNLYINNELVTEAKITTATKINNYAFKNCTSLTSVIIGNSVTSIDNEAFKDCGSLTSVIIGNNVTSIGYSTFCNCTSLTNVTIPNGIISIGSAAFENCNSLKNIKIPDSVVNIGGWVFEKCSSLTSIKIPNSVTYIKDGMFSGCSSLISIEIPNGVLTIGDFAFSSCKSLTSLTIPNSVTSIKWHAFSGCSSLTSVVIPNSVTSIKNGVFANCSSLTRIEIPNSVTSIDEEAFYNCSSLKSVVIPDSVTSIGYKAFYNCSSLTNIIVDSNNEYYKSIDGNLYSKDEKILIQYAVGKTEASFVMPNSVKTIGGYAFKDCSSLTSVTIGNSVTDINYNAFENCSSLKSVVIPDSVTSIGEFAFSNCRKLENVVIPDSVRIIHYGAFNYCDLLKKNFNE